MALSISTRRGTHSTPLPHARGEVTLDTGKILWNGGFLLSLVVAPLCFDPAAAAFGAGLTALTLCLGHSVGLHRGVIHGAFRMGRRTELVLIYLATLTGIGGPISLLRMHDTRDTYQNQEASPAYYSYAHGLWRDAVWYLFSAHHGALRNHHADREADPAWVFLERTWKLQQLPWMILLFVLGGLPWVVWGVGVRGALGIYGHWFVNHAAHTSGYRRAAMPGSGEEGRNHLLWGPLAMGEGWHNNHHAWPASARFGVGWWELDPGWWAVCALRSVGLIDQVKTWQDGAPLRTNATLLPIAGPAEALAAWETD